MFNIVHNIEKVNMFVRDFLSFSYCLETVICSLKCMLKHIWTGKIRAHNFTLYWMILLDSNICYKMWFQNEFSS